jgi:pyruvate/2-oxoglutarate dehydrogenase complex dihydrolipoamide acyltransferase (E2) component
VEIETDKALVQHHLARQLGSSCGHGADEGDIVAGRRVAGRVRRWQRQRGGSAGTPPLRLADAVAADRGTRSGRPGAGHESRAADRWMHLAPGAAPRPQAQERHRRPASSRAPSGSTSPPCHGTGPGGRIVDADVEQAAAGGAAVSGCSRGSRTCAALRSTDPAPCPGPPFPTAPASATSLRCHRTGEDRAGADAWVSVARSSRDDDRVVDHGPARQLDPRGRPAGARQELRGQLKPRPSSPIPVTAFLVQVPSPVALRRVPGAERLRSSARMREEIDPASTASTSGSRSMHRTG